MFRNKIWVLPGMNQGPEDERFLSPVRTVLRTPSQSPLFYLLSVVILGSILGEARKWAMLPRPANTVGSSKLQPHIVFQISNSDLNLPENSARTGGASFSFEFCSCFPHPRTCISSPLVKPCLCSTSFCWPTTVGFQS